MEELIKYFQQLDARIQALESQSKCDQASIVELNEQISSLVSQLEQSFSLNQQLQTEVEQLAEQLAQATTPSERTGQGEPEVEVDLVFDDEETISEEEGEEEPTPEVESNNAQEIVAPEVVLEPEHMPEENAIEEVNELEMDADINIEPISLDEPEPILEPIVEPIAEPVLEPLEEPIVEPIVEQEPIVEPVVEPVENIGAAGSAEPAPKAAEPKQATLFGPSVTDIRQAISLGDRFLFQRELFGQSGERMQKTLDALNKMSSLDEAIAFLDTHFQWDKESTAYSLFLNVLHRRF